MSRTTTVDATEVERLVGTPLGRVVLVDPVHANDIRRWTQALHHPNRLHHDVAYATASRFGGLVAPQSFTLAHGLTPATAGAVPGTAVVYLGDEWWFTGRLLRPGDHLVVEHAVHSASPAPAELGDGIVQRGDNRFVTGTGEQIVLQRTSVVRHLAEASAPAEPVAEPEWSVADLDDVAAAQEAHRRMVTELDHDRRTIDTVEPGTVLPVKVVGPHSLATFTTEWRAYLHNTWGATRWESAGGIVHAAPDEAGRDLVDAGLHGPAKVHLVDEQARRVGHPRAYGYNSSMGATVLDHLADWAGEWGHVEHAAVRYLRPVLTGDVSRLVATVTGVGDGPDPSLGRVHLAVEVSNQRGELLTDGSAEVLLPVT